MNKRYNKKSLLISLVLIILLVIGIGYAYLTSNLSITGLTEIGSNTWDIHFENVQVNNNSVEIGSGNSAAVVNPSDNTEVTYSVKLNKPGDFYEFTVDVKNYGTIDGMIESINSTLKINNNEPFVIEDDNSNLPTYLDYSLTYSDDTEILPNHELKVGNKETYKVRVEFKKNISNEELPGISNILSFSLKPKFIQANGSAVEAHPVIMGNYVVSDITMTIGNPVPNGVNIRNNPTDAISDWIDISQSEETMPYYIKHTIENDIITESYIEFIINDELKARWKNEFCNEEWLDSDDESDIAECMAKYNNLVNGVYILRGGVDESNLENKPIFNANKAAIMQAFALEDPDDNLYNNYIDTILSGLIVTANCDGHVVVKNHGGYCIPSHDCYISGDGESACYWAENC